MFLNGLMKKFNFILIACLLFAACKAIRKPDSSPDPLLTIGDSPVSSEEFYYVYEKNHAYADAEDAEEQNDIQADIKEYLDLFINFKLKVKEAESLGMDKEEGFIQELEGYRKQLAQPYLTENHVTDQLVEEAYERLKVEVNASHILINVPPEAKPQDTLLAYNKITDIRERTMAGEDFEELAREYSNDPSALENGGNLGYFTALQMVYPFEDAAYNTNIDEISLPVRSRFGYHLIKVNDKRPSQGKVKVAHIMVRSTEGLPAEDSVAARTKISEIYKRLQNGGNWDELAAQFSDDVNTKSQGGSLPWISTGNLIPSFEDAAFNLREPGDISPPVKTPYGWHIIKLEEKAGLEPFEEIRESLEARVSKDSRSQLNKVALIKRLREENNLAEYPENLEQVHQDAESINASWLKIKDTTVIDLPIFAIADETYYIKDFFTYAEKKDKPDENPISRHEVNLLYQAFLEESLLDYEERHLAEKYPDYRMLINEYREGILLFQLMDEKVWSKALLDTAGLQQFFEQTQEKYLWQERADASILNVANEEILNRVKRELGEHAYSDSLVAALSKTLNEDAPLSFQHESGLFEPASHPALNEVAWAPGRYTIEKDDRIFYIVIHKLVPPSLKELDEIRGVVISDYQDYLENEWVSSLKEKYEVQVDGKVLKKVYEKYESD